MPPRPVLDKRGRLAAMATTPRVELEIGCGHLRRHPGAVSIDIRDCETVDVVGDVYDVLARIPDASVDAVYSSHFVEHLDDVERFVLELGRVMKIGGVVTTVAPHFSNPYFYSDYTHRRAFGLYSFSYLSRDAVFRRTVPRYIADTGFDLVSARLIFKAPRPFYVGWALGRVAQTLVNVTTATKEWYERRWCYLMPCYEVEYVLVRVKS
jgi:SAM-dependent methyltransferase